MNNPSQAPAAAPRLAARPVVIRPITVSIMLRSLPTIEACSTGNRLSAR
jgi:hypothetical protein